MDMQSVNHRNPFEPPHQWLSKNPGSAPSAARPNGADQKAHCGQAVHVCLHIRHRPSLYQPVGASRNF